MVELLNAALLPENIVYTVLLCVVLLYWGMVILGALDLGAFDMDVDIDADIDIDVDVDLDVDVDVDADIDADVDSDVDAGGSGGGFMIAMLRFFNFGKVPFMVLMSFIVLSLWLMSVLANHYINDGSIWFPFVIFIPMLFIALIVAKVFTTPLIGVFDKLDDTAKEINFIGKTAKITLFVKVGQTGQAELYVNDYNMLLMVKGSEKVTKTIERGTEVVIVDHNEDKSIYFVEPTT